MKRLQGDDKLFFLLQGPDSHLGKLTLLHGNEFLHCCLPCSESASSSDGGMLDEVIPLEKGSVLCTSSGVL